MPAPDGREHDPWWEDFVGHFLGVRRELPRVSSCSRLIFPVEAPGFSCAGLPRVSWMSRGVRSRMDQAGLELDRVVLERDEDSATALCCASLAEIRMLGVSLQGLLAGLPVVLLSLILFAAYVAPLLPGFAASGAVAFGRGFFRVMEWRRGVDSAALELRSLLRSFSTPARGPREHCFRLVFPGGAPPIGLRVEPPLGEGG